MSRVKRSTWYKWPRGEFRTGQTIWRVVVFLLFFIYVSFLHILFYRKHSCNNRKTKSKTNTTKKKNIQKCGGQAASNSIWLCPSNKTKFPFFFFLFFLVLKLYPYVVPFTIKGRELTRSFSHLLISFFLLLLAKNKSLLFVFNMDIQILNKYVFRRN